MFCRILALLFTYYVAKKLGVENYGLYAVAMSYFTLVLTISDLGLGRYVVREVASTQKDPHKLFTNIIVARVGLLIITVGLFSLGLYILDPLKIRVYLTLIALLGILPTAISLTFENFLIAKSNFKLSTWGLIIFNLLNISLGILFIMLGFSVLGVIFGGLTAETLYIFVSYLFFKELKIKLTTIDMGLIKEIIKGSIPYGFLGILGLLYFKIDTLLLSYLRNSYETGIYGVGYKFLENIIFIPAAVSLVSFPIAAKMHTEGGKEIKSLFRALFLKMGFIGVIVMLGFLIFAPFLPKILPAYSASVGVIRVISLAIPFIFLHVPLSQLVLSSNKFLGAVIKISLIPVSFNIILNLIFIPKFGFMAAAWITVLSDMLSFVLLMLLINQKLLGKHENS